MLCLGRCNSVPCYQDSQPHHQKCGEVRSISAITLRQDSNDRSVVPWSITQLRSHSQRHGCCCSMWEQRCTTIGIIGDCVWSRHGVEEDQNVVARTQLSQLLHGKLPFVAAIQHSWHCGPGSDIWVLVSFCRHNQFESPTNKWTPSSNATKRFTFKWTLASVESTENRGPKSITARQLHAQPRYQIICSLHCV